MKIIFLYLLIFFIAQPFSSEAQEVYKKSCPITPEIWTLGVLPAPSHKNDLSKPHNKDNHKTVALKGQVFDEHCVPVGGAMVKVWQVNKKNGMHVEGLSSGTAVTNNLGEFEILMPLLDYNLLNIVQVSVDGVVQLQTRVFFSKNAAQKFSKDSGLNFDEKQINLISARKDPLSDSDLPIYFFNIIVREVIGYKQY